MTVLNLHALDVSFPVRAVALTNVVLFADVTGSGCTNSLESWSGNLFTGYLISPGAQPKSYMFI